MTETEMSPEGDEIFPSPAESAASGLDDSSLDAPLPDAPLAAILEALLFASDQPVTLEEVNAIVGGNRLAEVESALSLLGAACLDSGRGLRVQAIAGGYRITTDPGLGPYVRELVKARNRQRLSRAALETLAIVAYKQPITAPEIQEIRGVNPSTILSALLDRRLVRILGRKKVVGKPFLYGTSRDFLVRFGLNALEDLPSMEEFDTMLQEQAMEDQKREPDHASESTIGDESLEDFGDLSAGAAGVTPEESPSPGTDADTAEAN